LELTIQVDIASPSGTLVGLRLFVFRTFFYKLWGIDLKFCIWLCNHVSQTKFVFPGILSNFESVMPLFGHRIIVLSWRSYSVAFAVLLLDLEYVIFSLSGLLLLWLMFIQIKTHTYIYIHTGNINYHIS
jgi:hypothetical protein